jgi:hypothetical protein
VWADAREKFKDSLDEVVGEFELEKRKDADEEVWNKAEENFSITSKIVNRNSAHCLSAALQAG